MLVALHAPRIVPLFAAILLGFTAWTFASGVILRLAPPPETLVRALERLIRLTDEGAVFMTMEEAAQEAQSLMGGA